MSLDRHTVLDRLAAVQLAAVQLADAQLAGAQLVAVRLAGVRLVAALLVLAQWAAELLGSRLLDTVVQGIEQDVGHEVGQDIGHVVEQGIALVVVDSKLVVVDGPDNSYLLVGAGDLGYSCWLDGKLCSDCNYCRRNYF